PQLQCEGRMKVLAVRGHPMMQVRQPPPRFEARALRCGLPKAHHSLLSVRVPALWLEGAGRAPFFLDTTNVRRNLPSTERVTRACLVWAASVRSLERVGRLQRGGLRELATRPELGLPRGDQF